ncbi:MAG: hypothetical protein IPO02_09510 [Bacteroidetes bacterium]|nr:hypothetical protein [Bacteroidota bacterium]
MKKITFILISVLFFAVSQAQKVQINVHTYGGNQRLYFPHPHSWYTNQGYQYSRHGYYIHNGKKYIQTEKNIISQTVIMVAETMVTVTLGCTKTKMAITPVVIKIKEARVNASSSLFNHQCCHILCNDRGLY